MKNSVVIKALESLNENVDNTSNLNKSEKHVLKMLIDKLVYYYVEKINNIFQSTNNYRTDKRFTHLTIQITDYIVLINDTILGKNDPFAVVNMIYKEINYDTKTGKFKRKRLI